MIAAIVPTELPPAAKADVTDTEKQTRLVLLTSFADTFVLHTFSRSM